MLNWIRDGINYHEQRKLKNCLFCGSVLPEERRSMLKALIDDRFNDLTRRITQAAGAVDRCTAILQQFLVALPSAAEISQSTRADYEAAIAKVKELVTQGLAQLKLLSTKLKEKGAAPNNQINVSDLPSKDELDDWQFGFAEVKKQLTSAIEAHNQAHDDFSRIQNDARNRLKRHFLAEGQDEFSENTKAQQDADAALEAHKELIEQTSEQVEELKQQVRQHGPAAEVINSLLKAYLGHNELMIFVRDGEEVGYEIRRRGRIIRGTLSQGERTALSLCYFLSGLEAENRRLKDLIVVIDDPVSSLGNL